VILTSGHPRERVGKLPPGVAYMPKPWQPLNVLIAAEQAVSISGDVRLRDIRSNRAKESLPPITRILTG
jgi:hypothetical protein